MKLDNDTLAVLSGCSINGNRVTIGQPGDPPLDRKLYEKVNKVLVALGGKWTSKVKAHVFPEPAIDRMEATLLAGEVMTASDLGYFATPDPLADHLVALAEVQPGSRCLEPSAGEGAIVKAMLRAGALRQNIMAVELDEQRFMALSKLGTDHWRGDFMKTTQVFCRCNRIVSNPPFGLKVVKTTGNDFDAHILHMWRMLGEEGVLVSVAPAGLLYRRDAKYANLRGWVKSRGGSIDELPPGSFTESGTNVASCVIRIEKNE